MKANNECKIVQDLLPNYIENLTSNETSEFIKGHLDNCKECNEIYNKMNIKLESNTENSTKKDINFFKKYNKRLFLFKLIIVIILIIFIIATARKMIIISNLSSKAEEFVKSDNYHYVEYNYNYGKYEKIEKFKLGDKIKLVFSNIDDENHQTITIFTKEKISEDEYGSRYLANIYVNNNDNNVAYLNRNIGILVELQDVLHTENLWDLLKNVLTSSINTTKINGKNCYFISNFNGVYNYYPSGIYIDKELGMPVSTVAKEYENSDGTKQYEPPKEFKYEFNTVGENDFIEPNIEKFEVENME